MEEKEIRILKGIGINLRAADGERGRGVTGYAALFNSRSVDLGGFVEEIAPGAFARTLANTPDVRFTVEHSGGLNTLGRTTNGTLQLWEDEVGLRFDVAVADTQAGRDALLLVERGDVDQMSFAFRVARENQEWTQLSGTLALRRLMHIDLNDGDVSLVSYPAYPQTTAEARSRAEAARGAGVPDAAEETGEDEAAKAAGPQARAAARRRAIRLMEL